MIDGQPVAAALIEAADLHLLAGEVIVDEIDLEPRVGRIARIRIAADQLAQRVERLAGDLLVARDVVDLLVIIDRDQIIGIGRVAVAGMDRQEALRRLDRGVVVAREIIAVGAHQLGAARPDRIGMLALDLVEQRRRHLVLALVEPLARKRVERVDVARDEARIGLLLAAPAQPARGARAIAARAARMSGREAGRSMTTILSGSIRRGEAARRRARKAGWDSLA